MPLISTTVPNLINGVSQQADSLRFPSQVDEQIDGLSSVIDGLSKRPPTQHVAELLATTGVMGSGDDALLHSINRDLSERYLVAITGGLTPAIKVFDITDGSEQPVKNEAGDPITGADLTYLATATPRKSLRALTVADFTFFVNRETTCAMDAATVAARGPEALLFVKQAKYDAKYDIKLYDSPTSSTPDYTATYTTTNATSNVLEVQGEIMKQLKSALDAAGAAAVYTYSIDGSLMHIEKSASGDFRVEVESEVPEGLFAFKDTVQSFSLLPKRGYGGFLIKVTGVPEDAGDDYYLKFVSNTTGVTDEFSGGSWEEARKTLIKYKFDRTTVPHVLVSDGADFTFKPATWTDLLVGDSVTNPDPSFIGQKIKDVYFYKGRLGFLSDENIVLSEVSGFFNFWRTSIVTLLDSDPIDIGVTHTKVSILENAVSNNKLLLLFANQSQFSLEGGELLTPKSVSAPQVSEFENLTGVRPIALGNTIFFAFNRGGFSGVSEFFPSPDEEERFTAQDRSAHVPKYIKGDIFKLVGSDTENLIVALSDGLSDGFYVYKFFRSSDGALLQAAWSKFKLPGGSPIVKDAFIIDTTLYLVVVRDSKVYLEKMFLESGVTDPDSDWVVRLDRRMTDQEAMEIAYDEVNDLTLFHLPFTFSGGSQWQVVARSGAATVRGEQLTVDSAFEDLIKVRGNHTSTPFWVGVPYTHDVELTRPTLRGQSSVSRNASLPINLGRFQVLYGYLSYDDTMYFRIEVTPTFGTTWKYTFDSRVIGTGTAVVGQPLKLADGTFQFPVKAKADEVVIRLINDSPYPNNFLSIDWEGFYKSRSQRV